MQKVVGRWHIRKQIMVAFLSMSLLMIALIFSTVYVKNHFTIK